MEHRLERLEPYEGKLSRTVPRGVRAGQPACTYPIAQLVRHEVTTDIAQREQFTTEPCVSPQVSHGSRRKTALRFWVWSLPNNVANPIVSFGEELGQDDRVKTK